MQHGKNNPPVSKWSKALQAQALSQPLIAIANYFFDTIPQDLFLIEDRAIAF